MSERKPYPSDVSDAEWKILEPLLPQPCQRGRALTYQRREILNAIFYLLRSGCAWRMLPHDFPSYKIVSHYFYTWRDDGSWQKLHDALRGKVRRAAGRKTQPTAASIDSQSVKTGDQGGARGFDAGKQVIGRKRHLLVDTMGLLLGVLVTAASVQDRDGAKEVFAQAEGKYPRLRKIWADGSYAGKLVAWVAAKYGWALEIVKHIGKVVGFKLLPRRWVVERSFGWLNRARRLSKDYEQSTASSETMIILAMSRLMLRRLAKAVY